MTADILEILARSAEERVAAAKKEVPLDKIREQAFGCNTDTGFPFEKALDSDTIEFICECKKASPSKGLIAPDFPYLEIAKQYEDAGAACISVLTEPTKFLGEDRYLKEIAETVHLPCLRKDFVVDEYMIYQAKLLGASAVLLICSILDEKRLQEYADISRDLGLSVLCESHDRNEVEIAVASGAKVIGVNNRDLRTFKVDINNCIRLREYVPDDRIFVAESGIKTPAQVAELYHAGVNAALIGETFMRSPDRKKALAELRGEI